MIDDEWLPVSATGNRTWMSVSLIRKRLIDGEIVGKKINNAWYVHLPSLDSYARNFTPKKPNWQGLQFFYER